MQGGCFVLVGGWVLPPLYPAGGVPALSPPCPAFSLLPCPPSPKGKDIPPTPFPGGEGGDPKFISPGATAPGTPTFNRLQHLQFLPLLYPGGGVPALSPPSPALACFPAPYPPSPLPRRGRGRPKVYFAEGYRPRHPCTEPPAALTVPSSAVPGRGACLLCRLPPLPFRHPQGGLPFSSPAYPAFGLLSCPLSPRPPSPVGKGEL